MSSGSSSTQKTHRSFHRIGEELSYMQDFILVFTKVFRGPLCDRVNKYESQDLIKHSCFFQGFCAPISYGPEVFIRTQCCVHHGESPGYVSPSSVSINGWTIGYMYRYYSIAIFVVVIYSDSLQI